MSKIEEVQDFYMDYANYEMEDEEAQSLIEFCEQNGFPLDSQGIADIIIDDVKKGMDVKDAIEVIAADNERSTNSAVYRAVFFGQDMSQDIYERVREDKKNLYQADPDRAVKQGHTNQKGEPIWTQQEAADNQNREPGEIIGERYVKKLFGFGYPVEEGGNIEETDLEKVKPLSIERWEEDSSNLQNFVVPEGSVEFEASGPNTQSKYKLYHSGATQFEEVNLDAELDDIMAEIEGLSPETIRDKIQDEDDRFRENDFVGIVGRATSISESQSGDKNIIVRAAGEMISARVSSVQDVDFGVGSEIIVLGEPWIPEDNVGKDKGVVLAVSDHYDVTTLDKKGPDHVDTEKMAEKAKQTVQTDGSTEPDDI